MMKKWKTFFNPKENCPPCMAVWPEKRKCVWTVMIFNIHITCDCLCWNQFKPAVNFINVLRARFLYESYVLAAFLVTFWLWRQNFVRKKRAKTLMKLTPEQSGASVLTLVQIIVHQVQLGEGDQGNLIIRVELERILFVWKRCLKAWQFYIYGKNI